MIPFGFSVGDFVVVIKLLSDLGRAILESRGSVQEICSTIQLLAALSNALEEAKDVFCDWWVNSSTFQRRRASSVINGIVAETQICRQMVNDFLAETRAVYGIPVAWERRWGGTGMGEDVCISRCAPARLGNRLQGPPLALNVGTGTQIR
ncbi:MAG: hypothetical protein M1839_009510 [Geoglossum umbratile]|nr:MAG: hypothetical protein M1839_009510 [Geoglossum umbratile]